MLICESIIQLLWFQVRNKCNMCLISSWWSSFYAFIETFNDEFVWIVRLASPFVCNYLNNRIIRMFFSSQLLSIVYFLVNRYRELTIFIIRIYSNLNRFVSVIKKNINRFLNMLSMLIKDYIRSARVWITNKYTFITSRIKFIDFVFIIVVEKTLASERLKVSDVRFLTITYSYGVFLRMGIIKHQFSILQSVVITCAQNLCERECSTIIVLVVSCSVLFFFSTTPFCCGDKGNEKLCV